MHIEQFAGILEPDTINFDEYLKETDHLEKIKPARDFLDGIMHTLAPVNEQSMYPRLPFANTWLDFRPGEVTLWSGYNGSGKSMLTGQVLTNLAEKGQKICIASFEMKPVKTLARIVRQVFRNAQPRRDEVLDFLTRTNGKIWLYDQQGTTRPDRMIAVIKHCAEKLQCQHVVVDSLMKIMTKADDLSEQKKFLNEITAAACDYGIHIHLVVHLKKPDNDERMPTRFDVSGSADISNMADNVLIVWRNKKKERDIEAGKDVEENVPDSILICDKQRNGDWEGRCKLWYEKHTMLFRDFQKQRGIL